MDFNNIRLIIKNQFPTSDIIGFYLSIQNEGAYKMSLCPFHSDSKPSMFIDDANKSYKCLTCNSSGDAISFVMRYRNLEMLEAIQEISEKLKIKN